jgi:phosphoribosylglycinamide formyltransferase 1
MVKKINTCIIISGNGSNLRQIIKSSRDYNFPITIKLIISDNFKAKGLNLAKKYGIPFQFFSSLDRKLFERNSLLEIKKRKIQFICLAGFMRILSKNFLKSFKYKIINIHPSLLPKYKGLNTHKKVLNSKEKYSGCTVHFVSPSLDSGKVIMQKKVSIEKNETVISLKNKILKEEHKIYSEAIRRIF